MSAARSLLPREDGAYAQLGFPLITALWLGSFATPALALAAAAIALFLAHEPLLVTLGQRGGRARAEQGRRAAWRLAVLGAVALALGSAGFYLAPAHALWVAAVPLALLVPLGSLIWRGAERTTAGVGLAAVTLSSALLPVAAAGRVPLRASLVAFAIWSLAFVATVVAVRSVIARQKRSRSRWPVRLAPWLAGIPLIAAFMLAERGLIPFLVAAALAPMTLCAFAVSLLPVRPRHLRALGFSLAGAALITAGLLVGGLG